MKRIVTGLRLAAFSLSIAIFGLVADARAQAQPIKIGVIVTLSGSGAVIGRHLLDGFQLSLDALGNKLGGSATEILVEDDQLKPDVGVQIAHKFIEQSHVDLIVAFGYTNVQLAIFQPIIDSKTPLVIGNAVANSLAGDQCSRYIFSSGIQSEMNSAALAAVLEKDKVTNVQWMAPNYQGGKDIGAGFVKYFKGKVKNEVYTPLNQVDYSAELTQLKLDPPQATVVFYPGSLGVAFVKQYAELGLIGKLPLYGIATVDGTNLPGIGEAAIGLIGVAPWAPDLDTPGNKAFVSNFQAKYKYMPSWFSAMGYDTASLLNAAIKNAGGKASDKDAVIKAMETSTFPSLRAGKLTFSHNHVLVQNWYKTIVVKDAKGDAALTTAALAIPDLEDALGKSCKM